MIPEKSWARACKHQHWATSIGAKYYVWLPLQHGLYSFVKIFSSVLYIEFYLREIARERSSLLRPQTQCSSTGLAIQCKWTCQWGCKSCMKCRHRIFPLISFLFVP